MCSPIKQTVALEQTLDGAGAHYPSDLQINTMHLTKIAPSVSGRAKRGVG